MPRRRRRFSDLERQFRESGGTAAPGSRLAGYIEFKKGERTIEVKKLLTRDQRKRYGYAIVPFGLTPDATTPARYAAPITAYSNTGRSSLGLTDAKLGYTNIDTNTNQSENFYPALIRVFVKSGDNKENPTSGVTGKKYKRLPGSTYSIPFGRTLTSAEDAVSGSAETVLDKVDEEDIKKGLIDYTKTRLNVVSVSYEPEVFKIGKPDLVSPTSS